MRCKFFPSIGLCFGVLGCLVTSAPLRANQPPSTQSQPIRLTTSLVAVDALVQDKTNLLPIENLRQDDFVLKDNGKPTHITSFTRGQDQTLRPVQLWFVLMCNEQIHFQPSTHRPTGMPLTEEWGSRFLHESADQLLPALAHLKPDESIGVAHWCDSGESEIDVEPTLDHSAVLRAIERIASRQTVFIEQDRDKGGARAQVLALINNMVRVAFPPPFPAIISVGGKQSGATTADSGSMEVSAMDFGFESEERERHLEYKVQGAGYAYRLGAYLDSLHERYEFAFAPGQRDNKPHHVSVALTPAGKAEHPNAALSYREIYIGEHQPEAAPPTMDWKHLDSKMRAAVNSAEIAPDFKFELRHAVDSHTDAEDFVVSVAANVLTWDRMPNGDRRCVVTTVIAEYSRKHEPLAVTVKQLEIVQQFDRLPVLAGKPVVISVNASAAKGAAKVRVILRDVASGRIGAQDLAFASNR